MKTINLKSWNETEGRIRYYRQSVLNHGKLKGKKCNHVFNGTFKDLKTLMPKRYETYQKQIFTNGKWENVGGVA